MGLAAVLGLVYVWYFTDWLNPHRIQIVAQVRRLPGVGMPGGVYPISFTMDRDYRLTRVRVTEIAPAKPAVQGKPCWQLVSTSNSVPVRGFLYGVGIRGMAESKESPRFEGLKAGSRYRLEVTAGRSKGVLEFECPGVR